VVGLLSLLVLLAAAAHARSHGELILYEHITGPRDDREYSLRTMAPDGSNDTWLAVGFARGHDWAPDGSTIVLAGLEVMSTLRCDGTMVSQTPLPPGMGSAEPAWSPDGLRVAFWAETRGLTHIWMLELATGALVDLTVPQVPARIPREHSPSWSPDGTQLVYDSSRDREFWLRPEGDPRGAALTADLHIMTDAGAHVVNLTQSLDHEYDPAWSPAGHEIAFLRRPEGGFASVFVLDIDAGTEWRLTDDDIGARDPSWAPDGQRIVFAAFDAKNPSGWDIFVVDRDGGALAQITDHGGELARRPIWFDPGLDASAAGKLPTMWGELKW